jgi:hypothetical protein
VPESLPSPDANYSSGNDYIVEFLGYRFSFGAADFEGRVVAAAVKLGIVETPDLDEDETDDLVALAAQGMIEEPASPWTRRRCARHSCNCFATGRAHPSNC